MAYVVGDGCVRCKYTDCVDVLVIDPETCIDCTLCVPECPAEAIFPIDEVPDDQKEYIALNAELAKIWPGINESTDPLDDADDWVEVHGKLQYLER